MWTQRHAPIERVPSRLCRGGCSVFHFCTFLPLTVYIRGECGCGPPPSGQTSCKKAVCRLRHCQGLGNHKSIAARSAHPSAWSLAICNKMETTILSRYRVYRGYIGIMERKMETIILYSSCS